MIACNYLYFVSLCVPMQKYILHFFRDVIDQQTWSDSGTVSERRLRSEVLSLACHLDYPPCLERADQLFKDWLQSHETLKFVKMMNCNISPSLTAIIRVYVTCLLHVFTVACLLMWQRRCTQWELRMNTAGCHFYIFTTFLSLKHKNIRSCLLWPQAETQANCKGASRLYVHTATSAILWLTGIIVLTSIFLNPEWIHVRCHTCSMLCLCSADCWHWVWKGRLSDHRTCLVSSWWWPRTDVDIILHGTLSKRTGIH